MRRHLHLEHSNGTLLKGAEGSDDARLKVVKGGDGTRLKGVDTTAQGNALGIHTPNNVEPCKGEVNQSQSYRSS